MMMRLTRNSSSMCRCSSLENCLARRTVQQALVEFSLVGLMLVHRDCGASFAILGGSVLVEC
jgi:hypothetical protein